MTQTIQEQNGTPKTEAFLVLEDARIGTLPKHFGARMMTVEHTVYHFMREFVAEYKGAFWDFYELSNGGFYMAPNSDPVKFSVHTNDFEGTLSADAAGITVCLFTFSHLSFQQPSQDVFSRHFYALREFALDHKEAGSIFAAID
jgi:Antirestriction protein